MSAPLTRPPRPSITPRHHAGGTVTVGSTRWIIRAIFDQDVVLEASNASPGIIWRTTLDRLPDPIQEH